MDCWFHPNLGSSGYHFSVGSQVRRREFGFLEPVPVSDGVALLKLDTARFVCYTST